MINYLILKLIFRTWFEIGHETIIFEKKIIINEATILIIHYAKASYILAVEGSRQITLAHSLTY